jgi:hypothetical protein
MAITKLTKHDNHQVRIHLTKSTSKHYAALRCVDCNKHIQWLSRHETSDLKSLGIKVVVPWASKEELGI